MIISIRLTALCRKAFCNEIDHPLCGSGEFGRRRNQGGMGIELFGCQPIFTIGLFKVGNLQQFLRNRPRNFFIDLGPKLCCIQKLKNTFDEGRRTGEVAI
jgi:hypothetical protein